jgi:hypothetical protein
MNDMYNNSIIKDRIDLKSSKKTFIYENDLKFKTSRNIDILSDNNEFDIEDIKGRLHLDYDTLDYRLKELVKNNNTSLDLSNIGLVNNSLNNLPINYSQIKYLFINENKLEGILDLTKFINLEVVDIEFNSISDLILPSSIKEFVVSNNKLSKLPNNINPIRIKANHNNICILPQNYTNLELAELSYNNITRINTFDNLRRLIIDSNPLELVSNLSKLTYLDISDTNKVKLEKLPNITHLVLNSCNSENLPYFETLEIIEIINTPISRLQYFPKFTMVLCSHNLTKNISSKYVDIGKAIIKLKHNNLICISKEEC